jgi:hypothetical protein
MDRRLRQIFPEHAEDTFGGLLRLLFGDFAQLPPISDIALYSEKASTAGDGVSTEGH